MHEYQLLSHGVLILAGKVQRVVEEVLILARECLWLTGESFILVSQVIKPAEQQ